MGKKEIFKRDLIKEIKYLHSQLGRRPTRHDRSSLYYRARKYFGSWNKLMEEAGYRIRPIQYIEEIKLDKNFAYFLGLVITDGHIVCNLKKKAYKVAIYTSYAKERDLIIKLIKNLFNYNSGIRSRKYGFNKRINYEIRINSKKLVNFLVRDLRIPFGNKSSIVRVPDKIKQNDDKMIKKSFLRGVIDGDGSIILGWGIKIASGSSKFLVDLKYLLKELDVKTGSIHKHRKANTYTLNINNKEGINKIKTIYNNEISYPRKKDKISKI